MSGMGAGWFERMRRKRAYSERSKALAGGVPQVTPWTGPVPGARFDRETEQGWVEAVFLPAPHPWPLGIPRSRRVERSMMGATRGGHPGGARREPGQGIGTTPTSGKDRSLRGRARVRDRKAAQRAARLEEAS